jgi:choline dehydrogenase-like flavoprotein
MAFIDARTLPEATEIEADLIIIGGGMAGIAIAREFAGANKRVAVLESGGQEFDIAAQDLYRGAGTMRAPDNPDRNIDAYLHESRYRALGGAGNVWGGKCVPLDPSDFAERDWLPETGWPFTRGQLQPYYDRACRLLQIPLFDRDWDAQQEEGRPSLVIDGARDFFSAPRFFSPVSGFADRPRFDEFRTGFANAPNIDVYLNANVVEIKPHRNGRRVGELAIATLDGKRHTARGRSYVLATGGIENVRLLLASGLGERSDWIGRNFMGHVTFGVYDQANPRTLFVVSEGARNMSLYADNGRDKTHCVLAATLDGQRRLNIGNFTTTMFEMDAAPTAETQAVLALAGALDQGASAAAGRALSCFFMSEQLPHRESRITLDPANTDALGMPRVRLDWTYTQQDMDNLERAIAGLGATLGAEGLGRVCWPIPRSELLSILSTSRHHMGTTRMNRREELGVVDTQCRMHGLSNLYIAGSSVFPTSGIANPTLTLIALAMRMSDHLKRELGVRA